MEVNIENSFPIALRLTWYPFEERYDYILNYLEKQTSHVILFFLQSPLITTLIISTLIIIIFGLIAYSFTVVLGVFFITSVILMSQGLVIVVFLVTLCISLIIPIFIISVIATTFISITNN